MTIEQTQNPARPVSTVRRQGACSRSGALPPALPVRAPAQGARRSGSVRRSVAAGLAALLLAWSAAPGVAQTEAPPQAIPGAPAAHAFVRAVTLDDLGFPDGIEMNGLTGRRTLSFPLPRGLAGVRATLRLAFDSAAAPSARRAVRVLVQGRTVHARALTPRQETDTIDIPLDLAEQTEDSVRVEILYDGALADETCPDQRGAGDFFRLLPETGLVLSLPADGITTVRSAVALLPREVTLLVPQRALSQGEVAAALGLARALGTTGHRLRFAPLPGLDSHVRAEGDGPRDWAQARRLAARARGMAAPGPAPAGDALIADEIDLGALVLAQIGAAESGRALWANGTVILGSAADAAVLARAAGRVSAALAPAGSPQAPAEAAGPATPDSEAGIALARISGVPVLLLSGDQPEAATRFLGSIWSPVADTPAIGIGAVAQPPRTDRLLIRDLPTVPDASDGVAQSAWSATFSARDLPPGTRPVAVDLDVAVAEDSSGQAPVVSAFLNDRLMASTRAGGAIPTRLSFDLPDGLAGLENRLRVEVQRTPGACALLSEGYPAQLLPTSAVRLGPAPQPPQEFHALAPAFGNGVDLNIAPPAPDGVMTALPLLAELARTMIPPVAPIRVHFAALPARPAARPFISLSPEPPPGTDPPVRFDDGRIRIRDAGAGDLLDASGLERTVVAQIVESDGMPGLWLHTDAGTPLPAPPEVRLDRGNVAFIDTDGVSLAYMSPPAAPASRPGPPAAVEAGLVGRFRAVIFGTLWIAAGVLFVLAMTRMVRRRAEAAGK